MKEVAQLLNDMKTAGVVKEYALFGAMAQMRYTEAVATFDADVLVLLPGDAGLDLLSPIYRYCEERGLKPEGEAIRVGQWPVQFIPAFDRLTTDAALQAVEADLEGTAIRVVRADFLAAMALATGRAKDCARILALLECGAVSAGQLADFAGKYGLDEKWEKFRQRFLANGHG
jgi:hypothetical protein